MIVDSNIPSVYTVIGFNPLRRGLNYTNPFYYEFAYNNKENYSKTDLQPAKERLLATNGYFLKPICFDGFLKCYITSILYFCFFSAVVGEIDETIDSRLDLNSLRAEPIGPVVY